jgi:hypothetical protein
MNNQIVNNEIAPTLPITEMYNMIVNLQNEIKGLKEKINVNLHEVWEIISMNHNVEIY